jgi:carbon-monoxide dehydrogenase large subunit
MRYIGQSLKRIEDLPLLTGAARFAADFSLAQQLHMRVVRSQVAFGRLASIDVAEAARLPGVAAVWTRDDVASVPPIDFRMSRVAGLEPYRQTILARDYVRYVGEPVAVVFAENPYIAEDAAETVFCDIDELDPCLSALDEPVEFMPESAPGLKSEAAVVRKSYGDMEAAFAKAHVLVEIEVAVGRHSGVPLETRGALANLDPATGILSMHGAAKVPHYNRNAIAKMLGRAPESVQLYEGHVGGGFGVRGELYPEDVLACLAALRLGRPVKWIEDRKEHLLATNHSRDQFHRIRAAVDERGFILGLEDEFWTDQGAYIRTHGVTVSDLAAAMLPGPYLIPAYRVTGHIRLTNKTPAGTYRAPGRYESTFARERLLDAIAQRLGRDPIEVRRVNLIPADRMPYDRGIDALGTEVIYDSGDYAGQLDKLLRHVDYEQLKSRIEKRRTAGEKVGIGLAYFVEKSGLGPSDKAVITVDADGLVELVTGAASVGQGIETVMAQICGETLGVPVETIRVIHGQTDRIDYGMGAFASRVTVMTGSAVKAAAEALREKAMQAAAEMWGASAADLEMVDGKARRRDGSQSASLAQIARRLAAKGASLSAEGWFHTDHMNYPYGIHLALVSVDEATCGVRVERYVVACEVGRIINPTLVDGQLAGGAAQGIGGALLEEFVYDEVGQPLSTSFADYLMPTAAEVPPVETLICEDAPSPQNPLGVKGAGEGGVNAAGAAIAAAVDAAIGRPGAIVRLPITPARLHRLLALPQAIDRTVAR